MRTVFRLLSARYLMQRWDRSVLIVASIALGVATLVSTRILNQCIETAAMDSTTPLGIGDLFITNGELGVNRGLADEVRDANIPGVKSVQPFVVDRVTLPEQDGRSAVLIGAELAKHQLNSAQSPAGALEGENELQITITKLNPPFTALWRRWVVITPSLHQEWLQRRKSEDEPFVVRYGSRSIDCVPVALMSYPPTSPLDALGRNIIGMEVTQAARFLRPGAPSAIAALIGGVGTEAGQDAFAPPRVNRVDILLAPGADRGTVQRAVEQIVGEKAEVRTPESQNQNTQEIIGGIQIGFTMCSIGAMVVGLFLVYNALAVTVAERRHDIGILRSIGATRGQIVALFAMSALMLGFLGALLGVPLGIGLARFAISQIHEELVTLFVNPEVNPAWPSVGTILLAMASGMLTALLAALIPAIQAAAQDPADAVRRTPGGIGGAWRMAHRSVCAALVAGGVAMILTRHELPPRFGAFAGMATTLVGLLLAMPIFVGLLVQFLQPILRQSLPIEARLAADNLIRSPGRTGLVIGALAAGVAVMIQTAGVGRSNEEPITRWLDEVIQADLFVSAGTVKDAMSSLCPVGPEVIRDLKAIPGVEEVCGIRYIRPQYNGTIVFLVAIDIPSFVDPSQKRGPDGLPGLDKLRQLPQTDGVLVSENFLLRHNARIGDTISLPGPRGTVKLQILDTAIDYSWSRGTIFIDRSVYAKHFEDPFSDICHVFLTSESAGERTAARERVTQFASDRGMITADRSALRKYLADLIDRVYKLVNLQQIVVGIVAALGVVTSLLISVMQRKRELGLLLAVGATPAQVVRTVLAEAVLMGVFGTLLGIALGVPLEWYVLKVVLFEESGFLFDLILPWQQALGIAAGAILTATLAGLFPALQAVKTRIPDAIAYE
jgi:putative ABC transport system permease protein